MSLVYLNKLRGVRVRQDGVDVASAGRVAGLDFLDSALVYDPLTGFVTIELGGALGDLEIVSLTGASNTLALVQARKLVGVSHTTATTLTVPPNASVAYPIGVRILVKQDGAGQVTLAAGSGVTIRTPATLKLRAQYSVVELIKIATNEWVVLGDLVPATCTTHLVRSTSEALGFGSYEDITTPVAVPAGSALHAVVSLEIVASANAPGSYALNFDFSADGSSWTPFQTITRVPVDGALDANATIFLGDDDHCGTFSASHGSHVAGFVRVSAVSSVTGTTAAVTCLHVVNLP